MEKKAAAKFYERRIGSIDCWGGEEGKIIIWNVGRGDDGSNETAGMGRGNGRGECGRGIWTIGGRGKEEVGVCEERNEE